MSFPQETTTTEARAYVPWRALAWDLRTKKRQHIEFDQLFSAPPPQRLDHTFHASDNPLLRQVALVLDLEEGMAAQLLQSVERWTPSTSISLPLVLREYYADRICGIKLLGEQMSKYAQIGVRLVEEFYSQNSDEALKRHASLPALRQEEELALLHALQQGTGLSKYSATLFAVFSKLPSSTASAVVRAWYTLLLPLQPPPSLDQVEGNEFIDLFLDQDDFDNVHLWLLGALQRLQFAYSRVVLNAGERKMLRNYMERMVGRFAAVANAESSPLLQELCALGFGRREPFACDAFWAGQYPNLMAVYGGGGARGGEDSLFLASVGFTKRQQSGANVSLVSLELRSATEIDFARVRVLCAHARLLDSAPSRRPIAVEEEAMAGILLRFILTPCPAPKLQQQYQHLVGESLDCLTTLCERNSRCRDMVMRCTNSHGVNYLVQVIMEHAAVAAVNQVVRHYGLVLVRTVLERGASANFQRECAQLALKTRAFDLIPLLLSEQQQEEALALQQLLCDLCCEDMLQRSMPLEEEGLMSAKALLRLLQTSKPPSLRQEQLVVLHLFRNVFAQVHQDLLLQLFRNAARGQQQQQSSSSHFLGLLGPSFLPPTANHLALCMENGEETVFDLLLSMCEREPELLRVLMETEEKVLANLLSVTLNNENEAVLQRACALLYQILMQFNLALDPSYFDALLGIALTLERDAHLALKTRLVSILALGNDLEKSIDELARVFPRAEHSEEFLQAWSGLLSRAEAVAATAVLPSERVQLDEVWNTLCSSANLSAKSVPLLVQVLDRIAIVHERELHALASAINASRDTAIISLFILASAKASTGALVSQLRQELLGTSCLLLLQSKDRSLFLECCGEASSHALLSECFQIILSKSLLAGEKESEQEEWALRCFMRASKSHAKLLLSIGIFPRLLLDVNKGLLASKFALVNSLLEHEGKCEAHARNFLQLHTKQVLEQLGAFRGKGSKLSLRALQFTRQICRCLRLVGRGAAPDEMLQSSFTLLRDLAMGNEFDTAEGGSVLPMLEEFAEHCVLEEQNKTPRRVSSLVQRTVVETDEERAWAAQPIPRSMRRSSSSVGSALDTRTMMSGSTPQQQQQERVTLDSPFRRNGGNNLAVFFSDEPRRSSPAPPPSAAAAAGAGGQKKPSLLHAKVEEEIQSLLLELLFLFYPMMKEGMMLFVLDASLNEAAQHQGYRMPDVSILLSLLRWISRTSSSSGAGVVSTNRSRLAAFLAIYLSQALARIKEQANKPQQQHAWQQVRKQIVERRLLAKVSKKISPAGNHQQALLIKIEQEMLGEDYFK